MSPLRLKLAVCGSAALMVALLGSLLALTPRSSGLEGLGWTARLAVAVFLGAALTVKGFLNAILKTRSFPRAVWSALLGWVAAYTLFSVVSFPMDLLGLPRAIYELAGILLIMTPFTLPFLTAFTLAWYKGLQPRAEAGAPPEAGPRWRSFVYSWLVLPGLLMWGLATAWAWTVTGILEPAHYDSDNWMMGAGSYLLLVRGVLAFVLAVLAMFWAIENGTPRARLLRLAIAPGVLILFFLSVSSLDRTSPGFSEAKFQRIYADHEAGRKVNLQEARRRLGEPLFVEKSADSTRYFYTFTPSGGWGYHKRALEFDSRELLTQVTQGDEP
jgi:hypothetical protein